MNRHPTPAAIEVRPVIGKDELAAFIDLPWTIYQDDPYWVPPLKLMERERLQPGTNPFFEHRQ